MFLKEVWNHSKPLFFAMALFISAQLFVAYNRGMLFSPFYNYWMYSDHYKQTDSLPVLEVYSGGKMVPASDRITESYDYITDPSRNYRAIQEIQRLTGLPSSAYINEIDSLILMRQWLDFSEQELGRPIDSFRVSDYRWNGQKLERQ